MATTNRSLHLSRSANEDIAAEDKHELLSTQLLAQRRSQCAVRLKKNKPALGSGIPSADEDRPSSLDRLPLGQSKGLRPLSFSSWEKLANARLVCCVRNAVDPVPRLNPQR